MSLSDLIRKGGLREAATATVATVKDEMARSVAGVARVAVALFADPTDGRVIAYLIASEVLGCDIWFSLDGSFKADDGLAVFYVDELPFLATKDAERLREIHRVKLSFPGSRVGQ